MGVEDLLHALEGRFLDQRVVDPSAFLAFETNEADVERVAEHPVNAGAGHRPLWLLGCRSPAQSFDLEDVGQRRDRIVAGGEEIESCANMICAVIVHGDDRDLAAGEYEFVVAVADLGWPHRPAFQELPCEPVFDSDGVC